MEYQASEVEDLPPSFEQIELNTSTGLALYHFSGLGGQVVLARRRSPAIDKDELNRLYLHLMRLHTEVQTFFGIARLMLRDPPRLAFDDSSTKAEALTAYLKECTEFLNGRFRNGYENDAILADAFKVHERLNQGERETLLRVVSEFDRESAERLEWTLARAKEKASDRSPKIYIGNVIQGDYVDRSIRARDITNSGIIGDSNFVENSFNRIEDGDASDEVKLQMKALIEAVVALVPHISDPAVKEQLTRDTQAFTEEASAKAPRKTMLRTFGDAIVTVAKAVGTYGVPVIGIVTAILGLI
ncbi:MAG: hypothetical protein ACRDYY_17070 [Acidimicrobiales bacterium]